MYVCIYVCMYVCIYTYAFFLALFRQTSTLADKPRHWQSLAQRPVIPNGILAIPKDTLPGCLFTREGAVS